MELHYHSCGHPIRVRSPEQFGAPGPTYFDAQTSWNEGPITCCPQCRAILTPESLTGQPTDPAATMAAYLLAWPHVKRRLESLIAERARHDRQFYGYHAQEEINELYQRQIAIEARELEEVPEEEAEELALIYQAKGLPEAQARDLAG